MKKIANITLILFLTTLCLSMKTKQGKNGNAVDFGETISQGQSQDSQGQSQDGNQYTKPNGQFDEDAYFRDSKVQMEAEAGDEDSLVEVRVTDGNGKEHVKQILVRGKINQKKSLPATPVIQEPVQVKEPVQVPEQTQTIHESEPVMPTAEQMIAQEQKKEHKRLSNLKEMNNQKKMGSFHRSSQNQNELIKYFEKCSPKNHQEAKRVLRELVTRKTQIPRYLYENLYSKFFKMLSQKLIL